MTAQDIIVVIGAAALGILVIIGFRGQTRIRPRDGSSDADHGPPASNPGPDSLP